MGIYSDSGGRRRVCRQNSWAYFLLTKARHDHFWKRGEKWKIQICRLSWKLRGVLGQPELYDMRKTARVLTHPWYAPVPWSWWQNNILALYEKLWSVTQRLLWLLKMKVLAYALAKLNTNSLETTASSRATKHNSQFRAVFVPGSWEARVITTWVFYKEPTVYTLMGEFSATWILT